MTHDRVCVHQPVCAHGICIQEWMSMPEQTQGVYVLAGKCTPCCVLLLILLAFEIHKENQISYGKYLGVSKIVVWGAKID